MRKSLWIGTAALAGVVAGALALADTAAAPKVVVGPNILVSRDGDVPHVELMVAASPRTSKDLLGAAITATRPTGGWACRAYSSTDGGATWKASEFPEQVEFGGGDPQVAYTAQGTALMVALTMNKSDKGKDCASMHVWRSEDGGRTWQAPSPIPCGPSWDHEQIIVDASKGRFAGRIYIAALYDYPVYRVGVFRSDDDGRTWIGPVEAANGGGTIGINDVTPMVLSDGTLIVPYGDFQFMPDKRPTKGMAHENFWTVESTDGGITFSAPRRSVTQNINIDDKESKIAGFGKFAADAEGKQYRDRIYTVWEDARFGNYRILLSHSADRGKTWSEPKTLEQGIAKDVKQWQPAIAVNKDGVVGLTWFDSREDKDGKKFHQYFAASIDGGDTFTKPAQVSSEISDPDGRGNSQLAPMVWVHEGTISLSTISASSRWGSGGDYMGLAADKDGAFHPFWSDARSGTFQVYTARVAVEVPAKEDASKPGAAAAAAAKPASPPPLVESSLVDKVEFVFDPTTLDSDKKQLYIPVRLKNVSSQPIYPPIRIEVEGFGFPQWENEDDKKRDADNAPTLLNPSNGKGKEGAVMDMSKAIAGSDALQPGALTNPVMFRMQLVDPTKMPNIRLKATGMVPGVK
ncbi:MAG TPA: sialidase family protein [Thermoanaerobaculia bacterium]|jgi:hypothetical protein|nr:sialidase family protein [Thermoanaerobaculia bacterium]